MDNKKLKMLDQLTRHVRKYMLISPEAFDNYPSNIDTVIVGIIEEDKGNYSFVCNSEDLSGDIDDFDFKDGYKVCEKHYKMNVEKSLSQKAKEARIELQESGILY